MKEAFIVSACRTPIGKDKGAMASIPVDIFSGVVMKEAVNRSGLKDQESIDEVIFGNSFGYQFNPLARVAALRAGIPISVPAVGISRACISGATTVNMAATNIWASIGDVYVAGGAESMTRTPFLVERASEPYQRTPPTYFRPINSTPEIGDPENGIMAENMAAKFGVSRQEQDELGYLSQVKAERAIKEGRFKKQIVPIMVPQKKGDPMVFDTDEHPRFGATMEMLSKLRPVFKKDGTVTAGNSSGITDGAGAMVVMSAEKIRELGITPMVKMVSFAYAGVDPNIFGIGPVPATRKALSRVGLTLDQMDIIELNEAFASQAIVCCRDLGIDWRNGDRFNPNGGAIALGHPIAGSLAILVVKAVYELKRTAKRYALITACVGGGQGLATIIENVI
jgi:acetyl-CoA acetyltransferase family protein